MNIGGRPLNAWPAFIPATFELTILFAVLGGLAALFFTLAFADGLPSRLQPSRFSPRQPGRFFSLHRSGRPTFRSAASRLFPGTLAPLSVQTVEK